MLHSQYVVYSKPPSMHRVASGNLGSKWSCGTAAGSSCGMVGRHSRFAMLGRRHGAEDVAGVVDRTNHHADRKPASHPRLPPRLEQWPHCRPEASARTAAFMGDPGPPRDRTADSLAGALQSRHRQQVARMRPGEAEGRRRLCGQTGLAPRLDRPKQNPEAGELRNHRGDAESRRGLA